MIPPRLRRIGATVAVLTVFLVLVGATYQGIATSLERHRLARLGGLVDVGEHQLHIYCTGEGRPTVVLEAAAGSIAAGWTLVQPALSMRARVCSYDRAGLGWSESDYGRYTPATVPDDLAVLLDHARERGPFVLVGHELGALFARMFASRRPADTAALVLIDDPLAGPGPEPPSMPGAWPWLARAGVVRLAGHPADAGTGLPGPAGEALRAFLHWPDHLTQASREIARFDEVTSTARGVALDPNLIVTKVSLGHRRQPAVITSQADAALVIRAVSQALDRVRQAHAPNR
jgi:pimeloyl-ACP methyl ester carboxylesterase